MTTAAIFVALAIAIALMFGWAYIDRHLDF